VWCKMKNIKIITFAILILTLALYVKAAGVSSEYYNGNPLVMAPGETKDIQLELQNGVGSENIYLKGAVTEGNNFAKLIDQDTTYYVPLGSKIKVNVRVSLPSDIQPGEYKFIASFVTVTPGETSSNVRLGVGIDKIVPIRVNAPPRPTGFAALNSLGTNGIAIIVIILTALVFLIMFFVRRPKKK